MPKPRFILPASTAAVGLALAGLGGCAQRPPAATTSARVAPDSAAGAAALALEDIEPKPVLGPASRPVGTTTRPSIEALFLYAQARDELFANRRFSAVSLLERAAQADPGSYELQYTLGKAYRGALTHEPRSIQAMERAAAVEPDHLDVQLDLGRQYLASGDGENALRHLRLALQTSEYKADDPRAAEADLFLAHGLQGMGYERAALTVYERLLRRLADRTGPRRGGAEQASQITGKLYVTVGDLYMRQGQPADALAAFERAAAANADGRGGAADDFELQSRLARALLAVGRRDESVSRAAQAVVRARASDASLALLRDIARAAGRPGGAADELARLHARRPDDRAILFALAAVLRADDRSSEADGVLTRAAAAAPDDAEIVARQFASRESAGDLLGAARLLIGATARRPELAPEVAELWDRLFRPVNRDRIGLAELRGLSVSRGAELARQYALWRAAAQWPRQSEARVARQAALDEALKAWPVFSPTLRDRLAEIWDDADRPASSKIHAAEELARQVEQAGDTALAAELRGRSLLLQGDAAGAAKALTAAARSYTPQGGQATRPSASTRPAGAVPADLQLALAASARAIGDDAACERLLWKLISARPTYAPAYVELHDLYWAKSALVQADRVMSAWSAADPDGLTVRLMLARDQLRLRQLDAAGVLLNGLFDEFGDDPGVLAATQALYGQTGRADAFVAKLEDRIARRPTSFNAALLLAQTYLSRSRLGDASRVLDATRDAAKSEPDILYQIAHLYSRADQKPTSDKVLDQVLKLDPTHASAGNDLAYSWAEQGTNLPQAEALTRAAVDAEPDNPTLLDTLGWVLYKRGRFDEARRVFARAVPEPVGAPDEADPVVLDHMGDVMYRLNDREAAGHYWERSRERMAAMGLAPATNPATAPATSPSSVGAEPIREDLRPLRLLLMQKQRQLKAGQTVNVAPVIELGNAAAHGPEARVP